MFSVVLSSTLDSPFVTYEKSLDVSGKPVPPDHGGGGGGGEGEGGGRRAGEQDQAEVLTRIKGGIESGGKDNTKQTNELLLRAL